MGLTPLMADASVRSLVSPPWLLTPGLAQDATQDAATASPQTAGTDTGPYLDGSKTLADAFEAIVYRRQSTQTAVSFSSTQSAATAGGDGQQAAATSSQIEFSFFQEVRSEEAAQFRQRTSTVADGLNGPQRESYLQTSQRVAAQFEMSLSISGESLSNFSGAAGEFANKSDLLNRLLGFANELLDKASAIFNEFFSKLAGGEQISFEDLFNKLQQEFNSGGLLDALGRLLGEGTAPAPGGNTNATAAGAVQLEFKFSASFEGQIQGVVQQSDPVMLDLNNNGFDLTSYTNGARFDITGKGGLQNSAFVTGGDAFLALDRNGNGKIDNGAELFGDQRGARNGYEELRKLDSNNDGLISAADADFGKLLLFKDNGNGRTEKGELVRLAQAGIAEIDLQYRNVSQAAAGGNRIAQVASFRRTDGTTGRAGDAVLNYTA